MTRLPVVMALLLGVVVVATYIVLRHDPKEELEATAAALKHVKSWHEEYDGPGGSNGGWIHRVSDRVCPEGMHMVWDEPDAISIPVHREYFYTTQHIYYRQPDHWVPIGGTPIDDCTSGPDLDAVGVLQPLHMLLSNAHLSRGGVRQIGAEVCRDYRVKTPWREFVVCVNEVDHLPRQVVSSLLTNERGEILKPEKALYSRWNHVTLSDLPADFPTE